MNAQLGADWGAINKFGDDIVEYWNFETLYIPIANAGTATTEKIDFLVKPATLEQLRNNMKKANKISIVQLNTIEQPPNFTSFLYVYDDESINLSYGRDDYVTFFNTVRHRDTVSWHFGVTSASNWQI